MSLARYKLIFFSPIPNTRAILDHIFNTFPAHVGKIGNYERCAFITRGTGQFAPTAAANPTIGTPGTLNRVEEHRVEVLVVDRIREVVAALKDIHPYEEVAYDVYKLEDY
ncbi:GTP cyclohydrolase 1 type 2/Nif3 [Mycena haematopus]|nr:GTP cyclohydrolase 1 type 2/Nif3 [Mycena haematopus]